MDDYKIAFIYGSRDDKNNFDDGMLHLYGDIKEEKIHSVQLLDYIKEYYSDISMFKQLNPRHQPEVIAYFLVKMGHIVFLNTTKYDEANLKKYGKSGLFMLPSNLTKKQKDKLDEFSKDIPNYSIYILYNIEMSDGMLHSASYYPKGKVEPYLVISKYFEMIEDNKNVNFEDEKQKGYK